MGEGMGEGMGERGELQLGHVWPEEEFVRLALLAIVTSHCINSSLATVALELAHAKGDNRWKDQHHQQPQQHAFSLHHRLTRFRVSSLQVLVVLGQLRFNAVAVSQVQGGESGGTAGQLEGIEQVPIAQALYLSASLFNHSCHPNVSLSFPSSPLPPTPLPLSPSTPPISPSSPLLSAPSLSSSAPSALPFPLLTPPLSSLSASSLPGSSLSYRRLLVARTTEPVLPGQELSIGYGAQVGEKTASERQTWLRQRYFFQCSCRACTDPARAFSDLCLRGYRCHAKGCGERGVVPGLAGGIGWKCVGCGCGLFEKERKEGGVGKVGRRKKLPSEGESAEGAGVEEVERGKKLAATVDAIRADLLRLRDSERSAAPPSASTLSRASRLLESLRHRLHPLNRSLAEAEDCMALLCCQFGNYKQAMEHCQAALTILCAHYPPNSESLQVERTKLASIQAAAGGNFIQK